MRILITGASGQLGAYLLLALAKRAMPATAWSGRQTGELFGFPLQPIDLTQSDTVTAAFRAARPDVVIHAAALTTLADCVRDPERARRVNAQASAQLAELAAETGARLNLVSTDLVFDGTRGGYRESDPPSPLSVYGRTKVDAESAVLAFPRHAVARVSWLFGPSLVGRPTFFTQMVQSLRDGKTLPLFADEWRTPLSLAAAAEGLLALAESDYAGILHLGGPERLSRLEMGQRLAAWLRFDPGLFVPSTRDSVPAPEPRPRDTSLDSTRWRELWPGLAWPTWDEVLGQLARR